MKKNFKKLAILSMAAFLFLATRQAFAMNQLNSISQSIIARWSCDKVIMHLIKTCKNTAGDILSAIDHNPCPLCTINSIKELPMMSVKELPMMSVKELPMMSVKELPMMSVYYVYGTRDGEFKPTSFDEKISNTETLKNTNIKKIVYKPGSFDENTINKVKSNRVNNITIVNENLKNKISNVDFDIVYEFAGGKTIEFEVRLGELATNKNKLFTIDNEIKAYNKFAKLFEQNTITRYDIAEFNLPKGVQAIGENAFRGCAHLTTINIPRGVKYIGYGAFLNCTHLTTINIPNSVKSIGWLAFWNCTHLTTINIPNSVKTIESRAFMDCTNLTNINIPKSVTRIGWEAFSYCTNLTTINIPNSVKSIGYDAFSNCTNLTTINISKGVTRIGSGIFSHCTHLTTINIPNSVTRIGDRAFWDCTNLTTINIPNSVTSIGSEAFSRCDQLTNITYNGNTYHSVDDFFAAFQANGGRVG